MKHPFTYILFLSLFAFAACSHEEETDSLLLPGKLLELHVSATDFIADGTSGTRATDNDAQTAFEDGDRIGLFIIENGELKGKNQPYKYDGSKWAFDAQTAAEAGTDIYFYNSEAINVTYLAYYPYDASANGATSVAELKTKLPPLENQSSEENYRKSDLMIWESGPVSTQQDVNIILTHAYASVFLAPKATYVLNDDDNTSTNITCTPSISFIINSKTYTPNQTTGGNYRCILPAGITDNKVTWRYTIDDKNYEYTGELSNTANTRYIRNVKANVKYPLKKAKVNDYYCMNSKGEGYLVPTEVTINTTQKGQCRGVVCYLGNVCGSNYGLLDEKFPNGTIGLVVALRNVGYAQWCTKVKIISTWLSANVADVPGRVANVYSYSAFSGYANTLALKYYHDNNTDGNTIPYVATYLSNYQTANPTPAESSGWFWPTPGELVKSTAAVLNRCSAIGGQAGGARMFMSVEKQGTNYVYYITSLGGGFNPGDSGQKASEPNKYYARYMLAF